MDKKRQKRFLKLYEPVHANFERFCRARVYGDMDYKDLMNETLLKAYQNFDSLRNEKAFLSYLFSISVRILSNNQRKNKAELQSYSAQEFKVKDDDMQTDKDAEVYLLHQALAKLPEDQRESLILFEISGFSIKEIADIQDSSESAVKQRLRRGRLKLKEILSFDGTAVQSDRKVGEEERL